MAADGLQLAATSVTKGGPSTKTTSSREDSSENAVRSDGPSGRT